MDERETLAQRRVKAARILLGYRGEDVADRLGVPRSTYFAWEAGERGIPGASLKALARLLKAPWRDLVVEDEDS